MTESRRDRAIKAFLPKGARRRALAGDASFRRYERIFLNGKTFVLMDAPPEKESLVPFIAIATYLKRSGFSAPEIIAADYKNGLLLLEDLGDQTFNRILAESPGREESLYRAAVEVLIGLHRHPPPPALPVKDDDSFGLPVYDHSALYEELFLFPDWYLAELKVQKDAGLHEGLKGIWQPLFDRVIPDNSVLTLKDYHADNLMWLPDREKQEKIGLLDFQDGLLGHPAYDLVSLLQDARRPFRPGLEKRMLDFYLAETGTADREKFLAAYQILGAQRNAKIIGIFTRLWRRDGKPDYPRMIPHVWTLLEENLKHPVLRDARAWFDEMAPKPVRSKIPG